MIKGMNIAVQVFSVREDAAADFRGTLEKLKAMGYEGIEFAGLYGNEPSAVRKMLDEIGLVPVSAHVSINELNAGLTECVAAYKEIGCGYIAIPWLDEARRPGTPGYAQVKADIVAIAGECERQGMTLLYHNHDFEFVKIGGEYALDLLYKEIPALETEIDTCWVNVAGEDPASYVRKYAGRAPLVHLKDLLLAGQKPTNMYELIGIDSEEAQQEAGSFELRPLGAGQQNIPAIVDAAADAGTKWVIVEQDNPSMGKTPMECMEYSIKYLKTIGAQ